MVRAMKSIPEPSLPLSVKGPTRLMHNFSNGVLITIFMANGHIFVFFFYLLGKS